MLSESIRYPDREVEDSNRVGKTSLLCAGENHVRQTKLVDSTKALKPGGIDKLKFVRLKADDAVEIVINALSPSHGLVAGRLAEHPKATQLLDSSVEPIDEFRLISANPFFCFV